MIRPVAMGLLALPLAGSLLLAQGAEKPKVVWHPRYAEAQKEAQKDAEKVKGFSDARVRLQEMQGKALAALRQALDETAALAKDGKLDDALVAARKQQTDFRGTEVEAASATAVKSIERLKAAAGNAEKGDKAGARHVYQLIQKEAPDSPYAAIAAEKLKGLE